MVVAASYQNELGRIKRNIREAHDYFRPNYERYNRYKNFVFNTTLSADETAYLKIVGKPPVQYPFLEAYISRLKGEFFKQQLDPIIETSPGMPPNPKLTQTVSGVVRNIILEGEKDSTRYRVYDDILAGGFSAFKAWTDYENELELNQKIFYGRCYDPCLVGFDPMAIAPHKGDGEYCFELFPYTEDKFKMIFPGVDLGGLRFNKELEGFSWSYRNQADKKIILVADYYEKEYRKEKIVKISTGRILKEDDYEKLLDYWKKSGHPAQAPKVISGRKTTITTIVRYRLIEDRVLKYEKTDYDYFPLIFVDGNSQMLRMNDQGELQQMTRPYVYHAFDTQRTKNFAGQTWLNTLENMCQSKWIVPKEGVPPEYAEAYKKPQLPNVIIYNAYQKNDPNRPLPPPREVQQQPVPPEVMQSFNAMDSMVQQILGSYDSSLGINDNQLSGIAVVESATQSNAAAMPYIAGFSQAFGQLVTLFVSLIPKYMVYPQTVQVVNEFGKKDYANINQEGGLKLNYQKHHLNVTVKVGATFEIQQQRTLDQIIKMSQSSPIFNQFINGECLPEILDNMNLRNIDVYKAKAEKFIQQMQKQQQMAAKQPNPEMMKYQLEMQKLQMQGQKQQQDYQQSQVENQFKAAEIQQSEAASQNDRMHILMDAAKSNADRELQHEKHQTEKSVHLMDGAVKTAELKHRQHIDVMTLAHQIASEARSHMQPSSTHPK